MVHILVKKNPKTEHVYHIASFGFSRCITIGWVGPNFQVFMLSLEVSFPANLAWGMRAAARAANAAIRALAIEEVLDEERTNKRIALAIRVKASIDRSLGRGKKYLTTPQAIAAAIACARVISLPTPMEEC